MNKNRRGRINKLIKILDDGGFEDIAELSQEEGEAFHNLSEGLQQSDQGQRTEAAASALDSAQNAYEELLGFLQEAADG